MVKAVCIKEPEYGDLILGEEYDVERCSVNSVSMLREDDYLHYYPIECFKFDNDISDAETSVTNKSFIKDGRTYIEVTVTHVFPV